MRGRVVAGLLAIVVVACAGLALAGNRQRLVGTNGDDTLRGTTTDERLIGRRGDDILRGRAGDDVLRGGRGGDFLFGGHGTDRMYGGPGRDRCIIVVYGAGAQDDTTRSCLAAVVIGD